MHGGSAGREREDTSTGLEWQCVDGVESASTRSKERVMPRGPVTIAVTGGGHSQVSEPLVWAYAPYRDCGERIFSVV